MTLKISEGAAELTYPLSADFYHKLEGLHRSVYFKMLDDADYCLMLTTYLSIDLLKPVRKGTLTTEGTVVFSSKNL